MTAQDLVTYITWALYVVVFVVTLAQALRHPRKSTLDTALLFGAIGLISAESALARALNLPTSPRVDDLVGALLLALPYLLLRMVEDFSEVPRVVSAGAVLGLALSIVGLFASPNPRPGWLDLLFILYFVALTVYAAVAFTVEAFRSRGVTKRRMTAVAVGTGAVALVIALAGVELPLQAENPSLVMAVGVAAQVFSFISGAGYYIGFATPHWLRRAWQEPELYAFLARAAEMPRLPDTAAIVRELEHGAATSLGAWLAAIGLYDPTRGVLLYDHRHRVPADPEVDANDQGPLVVSTDDMLVGRVLREQRPLFSPDARRANPASSDMYQRLGLRALLAAPITAGHTPLGVLSAAARTTIFAEEDLSLLSLLANQAAVILESRNLIDEAAAVRAHEEANRMRDDFLSAAAHDLKTPLTSIFGQAQLLLRQAERAGEPVANAHGLQVIVDQTRRLRDLVNLLLDANRVERGSLLGARQPANLGDILQSAAGERPTSHHLIHVDVQAVLTGAFDVVRVRQMLDNLLENAEKYSPHGGDIRLTAWLDGDQAHLTVSDNGIGIAPDDLPLIFQRFQRGTNVDDRRFAGMGLGLYIASGVVREHGGRIWAESSPGQGATFHILLPLTGDPQPAVPLASLPPPVATSTDAN